MGKATKTLDDDLVTKRKIDEVVEGRPEIRPNLTGKIAKEAHTLVLVVQIFRMLERQIEEHSFDWPKRLVNACRKAFYAILSCQLIEFKRRGGVPVDISGKLIGQKDQRQPPLCRMAPIIQLPGLCSDDRRFESTADLGVGFEVFRPPEWRPLFGYNGVIWVLAEPVCENVFLIFH